MHQLSVKIWIERWVCRNFRIAVYIQIRTVTYVKVCTYFLPVGTYSFEIPHDLAPGEYTFAWMWIFRNREAYTSCWEATVVADKLQESSSMILEAHLEIIRTINKSVMLL